MSSARPPGAARRRRVEELGWQATEAGELVLRRRFDVTLNVDVFEVKLGDEYLMSSLFTVAEEELARLGLSVVSDDAGPLDVVVGGLGLGYTARTVLDDPRVGSLAVVEASGAVVDWHRRRLLPVDDELLDDERTSLVVADFFAGVADGGWDGVVSPSHAILVDIDHTPAHWLHPSHAGFYSEDGLRRLLPLLHPGGVFGLWSDDPPDPDFLARLSAVFATADARVVEFPNPLIRGTSSNTVYLASAPTDV